MTKIIYLDPEETIKLKGSDHRVLFQNAEGNINMGVLFNDPDVDLVQCSFVANVKVNGCK